MNEIDLRSVTHLITKGTTPSSLGSGFTSSGINFVKSESIGSSKYLNDSIFEYIDEETDFKLKRSRLESEDLLFSIAGAYLGKIAIVRKENLPANTNQAVGIVRLKKEIANADYVYYYFSQKHINSYINQLSSQSSQPNLNLDLLGRLKFRLREINEQKKIANVLSALDAKIELNNRINDELESLAKTIYDYWFVQFDFPNADGKPYKSSGGEMVYVEEGKGDRAIPAGWKVGRVSDLFEINPSETLSKGTLSAYIDMSAIPTSGFMTDEIQYKPFNGGMKFRNGDVVIARITPCLENGKTGLITLLKDNEIGFGSTEFIVLRGKNRSLSSFAACLSRSTSFRNFAISNMTGTSGRKRVDAKAIERFSIPIPEDGLISQFEDVVSRYFQLLTINTRENQQLNQLRDWLLPMLMNGQVSIK
jgi:type I restriction enzyme S subunit